MAKAVFLHLSLRICAFLFFMMLTVLTGCTDFAHRDALSNGGKPLIGIVTGLAAGKKLIVENDHKEASVTGTGSMVNFAYEGLNVGTIYNVTVKQQPDGQTCTVIAGSGTINEKGANLVNVTCADGSGNAGSGSGGGGAPTAKIGGTITAVTAANQRVTLTVSDPNNPADFFSFDINGPTTTWETASTGLRKLMISGWSNETMCAFDGMPALSPITVTAGTAAATSVKIRCDYFYPTGTAQVAQYSQHSAASVTLSQNGGPGIGAGIVGGGPAAILMNNIQDARPVGSTNTIAITGTYPAGTFDGNYYAPKHECTLLSPSSYVMGPNGYSGISVNCVMKYRVLGSFSFAYPLNNSTYVTLGIKKNGVVQSQTVSTNGSYAFDTTWFNVGDSWEVFQVSGPAFLTFPNGDGSGVVAAGAYNPSAGGHLRPLIETNGMRTDWAPYTVQLRQVYSMSQSGPFVPASTITVPVGYASFTFPANAPQNAWTKIEVVDHSSTCAVSTTSPVQIYYANAQYYALNCW